MVEIKLAQQLLGMGYTPEQIQTLDAEPDHLENNGPENVPPEPTPEPAPAPAPEPAPAPAASDQLLKVLQTMQTNMSSMQKQLQALAIRDITTPDQPKVTAEDILRGIIVPQKKEGDK